MRTPYIGLIVGLLLAIAGAAGGFTGFLFAVVLGAVGYGVGSYLDGDLDLSGVLRGRGRD
ncbi:DUF2273 domain-containing protein [Antrihabitans cavernicola]|uniref:DUF2273 domain-containing protein n=1 Tax=Antrihabitans cavernicola TaxID=2495913 RepID=A0A5A7SF39_9NOCA|nr:DUF2273 domain-containing protein [Spelaeibacter cavernicola]KAA0024728.1 DUF2273 domain-containing protein [Spelaeibacter cavernicola]